MRWIWIDKFTHFESGRRAVAVKNVTRAEEHLHDHFPPYPIMPASLIVEGMAQTAGILVGEAKGFSRNVILAKIRQASFAEYAVPGDVLIYEAEVETMDDHGATTRGRILRNGAPIGEVDLMFSHVDGAGQSGLPDHNFVFDGQFMNLIESIQAATRDRSGGGA